MSSIVISGIGLATPLGCSHEEFWENAKHARNVVSKENTFQDSVDTQLISRVDDLRMQHGLSNRQLKKMDRFSILAIAAIQKSIENASLSITEANREKIGLLIGNAFGGLSYVEEQLYPLYQGDMQAVNSYMATAWFPTAAQGEASILYKITGYSKTFSAGAISAGFAFEHAFDLLRDGKLDHIITGGAEAPLTPLAYNACIENQIITHETNALCEGSAMFMLEKENTAKIRGAKIHAYLSGVGIGQSLEESMSSCLAQARTSIDNVDVIVLNALGHQEQDQQELNQINAFFGSHKKCHISAIKNLYGNAIGANIAIDLALACAILDKQCLPPTKIKLLNDYINKGFLVSTQEISMPARNILINGINCYGECLTLMLSKLPL
jgi:3-oxoacyl-(acyl-carrier-protein) synthase